jgi:hypothetical protein
MTVVKNEMVIGAADEILLGVELGNVGPLLTADEDLSVGFEEALNKNISLGAGDEIILKVGVLHKIRFQLPIFLAFFAV